MRAELGISSQNGDERRTPAKLWVDPTELDSACHNQLRNLMALPFAVNHIAVMSDAHSGYGMPIGCILATDNVVIPAGVGVDIGCGILAVCLNGLPDINKVRPRLVELGRLIRDYVPVGRNWHPEPCKDEHMSPGHTAGQIVTREWQKARQQLGTLGGGNHFIEIQVDEHGGIWVMIHSGSRNLGKQVADFYARWALDDNAQHFSSVPRQADLGFFHRDHNGFDEYVQEMNYCIDFAKRNREKMMWAVLKAFQTIWPDTTVPGKDWFDICHNHMAIENHFGRNVCVHRRGAAGPYRKGIQGIIPGSMGSKSFIVSHTGEPMSYLSTSHGAGRRMSRRRAKEDLDLEAQQAILDDLGVVHGLNCRGRLDEPHRPTRTLTKSWRIKPISAASRPC